MFTIKNFDFLINSPIENVCVGKGGGHCLSVTRDSKRWKLNGLKTMKEKPSDNQQECVRI